MKVVEYDSSGYTFKIAVPSTVEEYDQLAKRVGATLAAATDHEIYHGTLGEMREALADLVEEEYKVARREVGTGKFEEEDGKKVEILKWESPQVYLDRVAAEKGLTTPKPFQKLVDRLSAGGDKEVKFDPSVHERKTGPKKLAAKWLTMAGAFLTGAPNPKTGKPYDLNKFNAAAEKLLGRKFTKTGNNDEDAKALGQLLKDWTEAQTVPG